MISINMIRHLNIFSLRKFLPNFKRTCSNYSNLFTPANVALTPDLFSFTKPPKVLDNNSYGNRFLFMLWLPTSVDSLVLNLFFANSCFFVLHGGSVSIFFFHIHTSSLNRDGIFLPSGVYSKLPHLCFMRNSTPIL